MPLDEIADVARLRKINAALISRVERSMDQQGNAFSLFQTAIGLEGRVRSRTEELRAALHRIEESNLKLVEAKESAELANLSKTRFLAAASHDVLQPLNAAHLSISALADIQTSDEGRRLVRQVERSLETMEDLLRTLLDISKLDAGVVKPEISDVALGPLFTSLAADFQPLAERKGIRLKFRSGPGGVRSDRTLLRRILQNIISNAVRYTTSGGVLVAARARGAETWLDVVDTGRGIARDQHELVFEEFHRGRGAVDGDGGAAGLGLGLSIVRRMAGALGHPISFRSDVGRGTWFRITVPSVPAAPIPIRSEKPPMRGYGLFGTRVLLVENDPALRAAMEALLMGWRCTVRSAADRKGALATLETGRWLPDLVIADQHLDGGDLGSATVDEVRNIAGSVVPALIVTADASADLVAATRRSGVEIMQKPVKPAQLRALLAHLLA